MAIIGLWGLPLRGSESEISGGQEPFDPPLMLSPQQNPPIFPQPTPDTSGEKEAHQSETVSAHPERDAGLSVNSSPAADVDGQDELQGELPTLTLGDLKGRERRAMHINC